MCIYTHATQDEVEADGGGLRVLEAVLRDSDGGEPETEQGVAGVESPQNVKPLLHATPGHHAHHVPLLRTRDHRRQDHRRGGRLRRPESQGGEPISSNETKILPFLAEPDQSQSACTVLK